MQAAGSLDRKLISAGQQFHRRNQSDASGRKKTKQTKKKKKTEKRDISKNRQILLNKEIKIVG